LKPLTAAPDYLGFNRNVAVLALSIFGLGLGEELWQSYLPKYLSAFGAGGVIIGLFASAKDLLDGLYQYPGGWINDRFGRRRALMLFTLTVMGGYALYAVAFVIGGLKEMGEPARKALIVDWSDPARGRAVGVYYTIRNLLIVPAGVVGGLLWSSSPQLPLQTAGVVGLTGVIVFWLTSAEHKTNRQD